MSPTAIFSPTLHYLRFAGVSRRFTFSKNENEENSLSQFHGFSETRVGLLLPPKPQKKQNSVSTNWALVYRIWPHGSGLSFLRSSSKAQPKVCHLSKIKIFFWREVVFSCCSGSYWCVWSVSKKMPSLLCGFSTRYWKGNRFQKNHFLESKNRIIKFLTHFSNVINF